MPENARFIKIKTFPRYDMQLRHFKRQTKPRKSARKVSFLNLHWLRLCSLLSEGNWDATSSVIGQKPIVDCTVNS